MSRSDDYIAVHPPVAPLTYVMGLDWLHRLREGEEPCGPLLCRSESLWIVSPSLSICELATWKHLLTQHLSSVSQLHRGQVDNVTMSFNVLKSSTLNVHHSFDFSRQVYDPTETRLLITHASIGREPILSLLSLALKADLTVSAGLHFRYGASWNEWGVQDEGGGSWWSKVARGKAKFMDVWDMVKGQVEAVIE